MRMRCKEMSTHISLQRMHILEFFPFRGKFSLVETDLRLMIDIPLVEIDLIVNSGQFQPMECLEYLSLIVNPRAHVEIV